MTLLLVELFYSNMKKLSINSFSPPSLLDALQIYD